MNEDYEITDSKFAYRDGDDLFGIRLLAGEFAGIEYTYGIINMGNEENSDGTYSISFDYNVREGKVDDENKEKFESVVGDVLNSVLLHSLEAAQERYNNENRNSDPKASD
jgi:hypothetical protein